MAALYFRVSARRLAGQWTVRFASRAGGLVLLAVGAAAAGAVGNRLAASDPDVSLGVEVIAAVAGAALGIVLVLAVVYAFFLTRAPVAQRDLAWGRLDGIRTAAHSYKITPVEVVLRPWYGISKLVSVEIRNDGRGGTFAAVLEEIDGIAERLAEPHTHVHWVGRPDVFAEEIPPGEGRIIAVGAVYPYPKQMSFAVLDPAGGRHEVGEKYYRFPPGTTVTLWLRVSARGDNVIGYSRLIPISIYRATDEDATKDHEPEASLPEVDGAEVEVFSPSFKSLLDY